MAQPNFFIVGAPKCGTTALYEYLRGHPRIFMPRYKEPHYFASDLGDYPLIRRGDDYDALFAESTPQHLARGEASVYYLHSSSAIPRMRALYPDARIIAMFRNPVDMVHALHAQLLYVGEETVGDFETAWRLQERRRRGLDLPRRARGGFLFQFAQLGAFGSQTDRLLSCFPRSQVKTILYDDFASAPQRVYRDVLEFLGVPDDGRSEFPRVNQSRQARITWLKDILRKPPPALRQGVRTLKQVLGARGVSRLKTRVVGLNTLTAPRAALSPEFRAELAETFRPEIALLGRLLGRDLSEWCTSSPEPAPRAHCKGAAGSHCMATWL
ncbi:MAG TPA: sulfotransferase [Gemmatimonadales bacterium]